MTTSTTNAQSKLPFRLPDIGDFIPEVTEIGTALFKATGNRSIPRTTISLVHLRAGQIAYSTYQTIRHTDALRKAGETEERITAVATWRDAPSYFTDAERAALALVEAVFTPNPDGERVPEDLIAQVSEHYDDKALATLTMVIAQFGFFLPIALITKPLVGVSPAEQ
ncbi:carboxymuconolactone decarboxylase family protein [Actinomadura vinacea]|uniref:Carboxymuconolactone decarboxylase family protein n=1 Tax=Actinomadura vinacea TaxID=115336 RepID=A0ABN3JKB4_9ACTN